jgi:DNA-binding PadR family transcriptional regulator
LRWDHFTATASLSGSERCPATCSRWAKAPLYPAVQRLLLKGWTKAQWGASENNRRARYYTLTTAGHKQLAIERAEFDRLILAIHKVLNTT